MRSGWVPPPPVFWIFMEQGKIMEAEVPTVQVGTTPTGLTAPPNTMEANVTVSFKKQLSLFKHSKYTNLDFAFLNSFLSGKY